MRCCFAAVSLFLFVLCARPGAMAQTAPAAVPACAELRLVPAPQECMAVEAIPIGRVGFFVSAGKDAEDGFAAEDLIEDRLGKRSVREDAPFILLERVQTAAAQALLARPAAHGGRGWAAGSWEVAGRRIGYQRPIINRILFAAPSFPASELTAGEIENRSASPVHVFLPKLRKVSY
jgi:hypothetical protein